MRAAVECWGAVNFLVHLVGAFRSGMRLEETTDEFWDEMLDVNLRTAVNVMRAVIPSMRQQRSGRITVVGATTALQPVVMWSAYCSSVAALCEVVRVAAAELREEGITVNAILPTTIATTFVRQTCGEGEAHKWVDPRSIGSLMLWLCSDAGRDVTNALIPFIARQSHPCFHWHGATDS